VEMAQNLLAYPPSGIDDLSGDGPTLIGKSRRQKKKPML